MALNNERMEDIFRRMESYLPRTFPEVDRKQIMASLRRLDEETPVSILVLSAIQAACDNTRVDANRYWREHIEASKIEPTDTDRSLARCMDLLSECTGWCSESLKVEVSCHKGSWRTKVSMCGVDISAAAFAPSLAESLSMLPAVLEQKLRDRSKDALTRVNRILRAGRRVQQDLQLPETPGTAERPEP